MKLIGIFLVCLLCSACGTVRGAAGGMVEGMSKDVKSVGTGLGRVADKIK